MNTLGLRRECERITKTRYSWTGFWNPQGVTYGLEHWRMRKDQQRKFLTENWKFDKNGRKIQIIGR